MSIETSEIEKAILEVTLELMRSDKALRVKIMQTAFKNNPDLEEHWDSFIAMLSNTDSKSG